VLTFSIDYYPHRGDPVNVTGLAISNGVTYSLDEADQSALCISADNYAQITDLDCAADTTQALAGGPLLIDKGRPIISGREDYHNALHPCTAVAIDQPSETLWLIIVDGRQLGCSEGVSLIELADIIKQLGAYRALNLDGGGSTTLVAAGYWWPRILNSPIHTRIPMRQRPVANHLGIYALPPQPEWVRSSFLVNIKGVK
jgi:exopolysaccharide biosynthesis protein